MEVKTAYLDTSPILEHYRKKIRMDTMFARLSEEYDIFAISTVTEYEILSGCKSEEERTEWMEMFKDFIILPFDRKSAGIAALIFKDLRLKNQMIEVRDIFIASIAIANGYAVSTLNAKHFERIAGLQIRIA